MSKGQIIGELPGAMAAPNSAAISSARAARPGPELVQQKSVPPIPSVPGIEAAILPAPALVRGPLDGVIDVSVLLGTVRRPQMVRSCIEAVRLALGSLPYEIVVAYGAEDEPALPWLREQPDL